MHIRFAAPDPVQLRKTRREPKKMKTAFKDYPAFRTDYEPLVRCTAVVSILYSLNSIDYFVTS
jgi:hypothetical protein